MFVAALLGFVTRNDVSPVVHPDSAFEEGLVQECLRQNACTTLGGSASFRAVYHMVGWLNFMTVAEWLGLGRDAIHVGIQILNALAIVLVAMVADRLGGPVAGALAPYFAFRTGAAPGALYDTALMAFFGTVLLVQCVAAARERPPTTLVVLATLTAAVVAEIHLAGSLALVSVLWVVLRHPGNRMRRSLLVACTFLAAVMIVSPRGVVWDVLQLTTRVHANAPDAPASPGLPLQATSGLHALIFLLPWIAHRLAAPWIGRPPRGLEGAVAVAVPIFAAYAAGVGLGAFPWTSYHYLEHGWPARAVVIAVPLAAIVSATWQAVTTRLPTAALLPRTLLWLVPLTFSVAAATTQPGPDRPQPKWADVRALARVLHDEWRWDWTTVNREVLSPEKQRLLDDLAASVPGWEDDAELSPRRPPEPIAIVAIASSRLPAPMPPGWLAVSRRTFVTLLVVPTGSSFRWGEQTTCYEDGSGRETCAEPPPDPHLLWELGARVSNIRRLVRRVPWRGTAGTTEVVAIPELPLSCVGRIAEGPPGTVIEADGRRARLTTPGDVVFEWRPDTPGCLRWDFVKQDEPPFVVASDAATVALLEGLVQEDRK